MFSRRIKILFVCESSTLAHVTRPLTLAGTLDPQHYEIIFASGEQFKEFILQKNYPLHVLPAQSSGALERKFYWGQPVFSQDIVDEYIPAEIALLDKLKPDLVVGDFRVTLGISCRVKKIPYLSIIDARWSPYSTELGFAGNEGIYRQIFGHTLLVAFLNSPLSPLVINPHLTAYNKACDDYGLQPKKTLREMYADSDYLAYPETPMLDPTMNLPFNHRYIGPVLWEPDIPIPESLQSIPKSKKIIYLSFGSSGTSGQKILEILQSLDYTVIVSTAGKPYHGPLSANIIKADFIPALKIMKDIDLVITNGGSPSAFQAFNFGIPILGIPTNMDQHLFMQSVSKQNLGIVLRHEQLTRSSLNKCIRKLLENPIYKTCTAKAKAEMDQYNVKVEFNNFLQMILKDRESHEK